MRRAALEPDDPDVRVCHPASWTLFVSPTILAGLGGQGAWAQQAVVADSVTELPTTAVQGSGERANGPVQGFAAQRSASGTKPDSAIEEAPAAITVIPREQLDTLDARTLDEACATPQASTRRHGV